MFRFIPALCFGKTRGKGIFGCNAARRPAPPLPVTMYLGTVDLALDEVFPVTFPLLSTNLRPCR